MLFPEIYMEFLHLRKKRKLIYYYIFKFCLEGFMKQLFLSVSSYEIDQWSMKWDSNYERERKNTRYVIEFYSVYT